MKKFLIYVLGILVVLTVSEAAYAYRIRSQAEQFLAAVKNMTVGKTSFQEVLQVESLFPANSSRSDTCKPSSCTIYFSFGTGWLHKAGLMPPGRFGGGITIRDGAVSQIELVLQSGPTLSAAIKESAESTSTTPYRIEVRKASSGNAYYSLTLILSSPAPEELRKNTYDFDMDCLTKLGGCKDARQMLPRAPLTTISSGGWHSLNLRKDFGWPILSVFERVELSCPLAPRTESYDVRIA